MDIQKAIDDEYTMTANLGRVEIPEQMKPYIIELLALRKELQQYRQIGTVDECRAAMEKQMSKDIEFYGGSEDGKMLCPNCKEDLWDLKECGFNNCPYCGQALKWGD